MTSKNQKTSKTGYRIIEGGWVGGGGGKGLGIRKNAKNHYYDEKTAVGAAARRRLKPLSKLSKFR